MSDSTAKLFQPIRVGNVQLSHRVVLAPLTRFRADDAHVPTAIMRDHYIQRASVPGTLLITEGTFVSPRAGGLDNVPGIWSDEQVEEWKKIVDAVHAQGSHIFMQFWTVGRAADSSVIGGPDSPKNPGGPYPYIGATDEPLKNRYSLGQETKGEVVSPRALTHEEILEFIELFGQAAHNAVHRAGFDGIEFHAAGGYLADQFLQDVSKTRTDQWGGSIENRSRFILESLKKIASVIGEERLGLKLTPFSTYQDMGMKHVQPTFAYLISRVREAYPRFAFLHVVEPRIAGVEERTVLRGESNDFLRAIWKGPDSEKNGSVYLSDGGYTMDNAFEDAEKGDLIVFGRYFTSNPDLPARIKKSIPWTPYDRSKFYTHGPEGYTDFEFADAETEVNYKARADKAEASTARA